MAATAVTARAPFSIAKPDAAGQVLAPLARIMAITYALIGAFYAANWLYHPSLHDAVMTLALVSLFGICVVGMTLARRGRTESASKLLTVGLVVVAACGSLVMEVGLISTPKLAVGAGLVISVNHTVAVVLAGLFLARRAVLALAGLVVGVFLVQWAIGMVTWSAMADAELQALIRSYASVLGLIVLLSLLASEYARRQGALLEQSERRTRELQSAKVEVERKMVELAAAKEEIERQKDEIERKSDLGRGVASQMREMSRELAATSAQQASGASEQAAAMSEIVAAMEELSRAAGQIAGNSEQVAQLSSTALHSAEIGREAVEDTIAALDRIRGEVRGVAEKNLALGQKTQAIGEIIEIITEIAGRTHILALNAAIESAAAGEYGRRFGVVASQVKELANEAKLAAHQVRSAVTEIQRAASATVLAAEKGESESEVGARLGRSAGDAILQMVVNLEDVSTAVKEMMLATQQQQSASQQVVSTVREMDSVVRQSAEGSRQNSLAVGRLMESAERLVSTP